MRFSRPFCFAVVPLLASCQVFTDKPVEPKVELTRMQGELNLSAGQLLFQPCHEQRQFILKEDGAVGLSSDANSLFADGHNTLYVDMRGQLQANAKQVLMASLYPLRCIACSLKAMPVRISISPAPFCAPTVMSLTGILR